jgi:hypothetical protein
LNQTNHAASVPTLKRNCDPTTHEFDYGSFQKECSGLTGNGDTAIPTI